MKKTKLKHRTRKFISFALAVCLLTGLFSLSVSADTGDDKLPSEDCYGYTYRFLTENTIAITDYKGYDTEVTIPSKIDGYTVTSVENFDTTKTKKITLPETVTTIGDSAFTIYDNFSYSVLEEIILPKNLKTIGDSAFSECYSLKSIDIPESVTKIGSGAFYGCDNLKNISVKSDIDIGNKAFGDRYNLIPAISKTYEDSQSDFFVWNGWVFEYNGNSQNPAIPSGTVGIYDDVFAYSDITSVTIPEGVKYINYGAFQQCTSLKNIKLPNSLVRINASTFKECTSLSALSLGEGLKTIDSEVFKGCVSLKTVALPSKLETLEYEAFADCSNLENVTFPNTLTTADEAAFYETKWYNNIKDGTALYYGSVFNGFKGYNTCLYTGSTFTVKDGTKTVNLSGNIGKITKFVFPNTLKSFTMSNVYNDSGYKLTSLALPESVDYVMITNQSDLKNLTLPTTAKLGYNCFEYCSALETLTVPKGNTRLEISLSGCSSLKKVVLADDTVELGNCALGYSDSLTTVDLKNVRIISSEAFWHCPSIQKITIPDTVTTICNMAFADCSNLTTVTGGKNVKILENAAFKNCTKLTSIGNIGQNLKKLGSIVFENTKWFENQKDGIVYLGKIAYCYKGNMPKNTTLTFKNGTYAVSSGFISEHNSTTHFEQPNLVKVVLPKSCKFIGPEAFLNCTNLKSIDLGGAEIAENEAFVSNACETITLPSTMRIIGDDSFTSKVLKTVNLNDGLQAIGEGAFFSYGKIKGITVPASVTYIGEQAIGYYPPDPDNPFVPSEVIPNFVIYGTSGTEAQTYADSNGIQFNSIASGTTVKGTAKSYLSADDTVTIQLVKSGVVAYETTVKGNSADYSISGVANGTYTMRVSKKSHADREYTVKVSSADVTQNVEIFPIGDVNSDGDISVVDATLVQKYIVGLEKLTDLQKKSAEVNGDGEISVVDATLIQKYIVGLENFS
nr:leucine-rich repeat protein [Ruminococcus bromii]